MRAIWLEDQRVSIRTDLPVPDLKPDQALIKVLLAGVCSTDLELLRGYYPYKGVPGHEFVGEVIDAPSGYDWVGQRVVGEINISCGFCPACLAGRRTHCKLRLTLGIHGWDGAFAEYLVLPVHNLHAIPPEVSDEAAVFSEPLAAALEIREQVPIKVDERWLVIGAGRLGQLVAQVLAASGATLIVVARHAYQRELLDRRHIPWISEEHVQTGEADVVVDTTGTPGGFFLARCAVRPRGTIVLKSTYKEEILIDMSKIVVDEIILIGSRCGPFQPALQMLADGTVDPRELIQGCYPLDQGLQALEHAGRPGVLKVLIRMM